MKHVPKVIKFPSITVKTDEELIKFQLSMDAFLKDLENLKKRNSAANSYVGAFLGHVLALEKKIEEALSKTYPDIEEHTFGGKILVLKQFFDHFEKQSNLEVLGIEYLKLCIPSLEEIRDVRNKFAHDFDYIYCPSADMKVTISFINTWKSEEMKKKVMDQKDDSMKSLVALITFCGVLSNKLSYVAYAQK